jgi:hypothetical protein
VTLGRALLDQRSVAILLNTSLPKYMVLSSGTNVFQDAEANANNKGTCLRLVFSELSIRYWGMEDCLPNTSCVCGAVSATALSPSALESMFDTKDHSMEVLLQVADVSSFQFGGGTILTVYAAILFTVASIVKSFIGNKRLIAPYIDMPYTIHLYQLVLDIVYARQDNDLVMEEILYNGLIDIYRDPHEMARWSGERSLKIEREWWLEPEQIEGFAGWPSFRETSTEPYMRRLVD